MGDTTDDDLLLKQFFAEVSEVERDNEVLRILSCFKLNPFEFLILPFDSSLEDVKKQYRKLSLLVHPDKCKHPQAKDAFGALAKAQQLLLDPQERDYILSQVKEAKEELLFQRKKQLKEDTASKLKSLVDEKFEEKYEQSEEFQHQLKLKVKELLTQQELRRRTMAKRIHEQENRLKKEEEEEKEIWKRKREHQEQWKGTREKRNMERMDNHFQTQNYQRVFMTEQVFPNHDELVEWVRSIDMRNMMILIIKGSRKGNGKGAGRVSIRCEREGKYMCTRSIDTLSARKISTKKCECPFLISGVENYYGTWEVVVNNGTHNHDLVTYFEGHAFVGKLNEAEVEFVDELTKDRVKPQQMEKFEENMSTRRHIYNARQKLRSKEMGGQTILQHVMGILVDNHYYRWHRSEPDSNVLSELLFANPVSVGILHAYPFVLEIDCTCKTNKYGLPLLQIIGVAPTQMNFNVAFAYMSSEKEENYMWVLERLKTLMDPLMLPTTIFTDRKLALISAVEHIFPTSKHLLCRFYVNCTVEKRCKNLCGDVFARGFLPQWKNLLNSLDEKTYEERLSSLKRDNRSMSSLLSYLKMYWLDPCKEKIVFAWANQAFHICQGTTNRVEGSHGKLKKFLETSTGSLNTVLLQIHTLMNLQHKDIRASLEKSRLTVPRFATSALYGRLRGYVASFALELIQKESIRDAAIGLDESACKCYLRRTHGLPCTHEINSYVHGFTPIPLSAIHPFWKILDIDGPIIASAPQEPFNAALH